MRNSFEAVAAKPTPASRPRITGHVNCFNTATSTMTFYGTYCTQLKNRTVDKVDVVYDCDAPLL